MRTLARLLAALLFMPAMAQTNMREINVISDQADPLAGGDIEFFQGESVRLNIFLRRGNTSVSVPTGALPVWKAWVDGTPGTLYINVTGTVVNASTGQLRVELTPAQSNATNQTYESQVQLYNSTTYMGVAWTGDLEILYSPAASGLTYVGTTAPAITELLAGANVTVTTNGSARTVAATDTLGALSPTAGRLIYGNGTAWTTLAAGTAGQVLQANGAAAPSWGSAGAGDIEGVTAGTGLSGGGTSGTVTLSLANTAVTAGSYGPATITVDAQGRLTAAATSNSAAIQSALGSVYLPLIGGTLTGNLAVQNSNASINIMTTGSSSAILTMTSTPSAYPSTVGEFYFDDLTDEIQRVRIAGIAPTSTRGKLLIQTADNTGTLQDALTLDYDQTATFASTVTASNFIGSGAGLTGMDASQLTTGDLATSAYGELRLEFRNPDFHLVTSEQVGYAQYVLTSGSPANALTIHCAKSANTAEQDFVWRSCPIVIPRGFVTFKTTGAIDIDWVSDDSTSVADIRGIRLVRYASGLPTTLYTDATTRNVSGANTITNISIDRSAFSATTVAAGDLLVMEITGTIEDSKCYGILHATIHSE